MPFLSGQVVTADDLNHLKPTSYLATATVDLVGSVTNTDVVGATMTIDTETDNAVFDAIAIGDFDTVGGGTTTAASFRLMVDGVEADTSRGIFQVGAATANDRQTTPQVWHGTIPVAGPHTIKIQASTLPANMEINALHTRLLVTIHEVV